MQINERFKIIREKTGMSKPEFGKAIGLSTSSVYFIEDKKTKISLQTIISICEKFKISANWLIFGKGPMVITEEDYSFISWYINLSEREKGQIDILLKDFK